MSGEVYLYNGPDRVVTARTLERYEGETDDELAERCRHVEDEHVQQYLRDQWQEIGSFIDHLESYGLEDKRTLYEHYSLWYPRLLADLEQHQRFRADKGLIEALEAQVQRYERVFRDVLANNEVHQRS